MITVSFVSRSVRKELGGRDGFPIADLCTAAALVAS